MNHSNIDCISVATILEATWTNCPEEVKIEIRQLWQDKEYGNDNYYYQWDWNDEEVYPDIASYLKSRGFTEDSNDEVLIHYWW